MLGLLLVIMLPGMRLLLGIRLGLLLLVLLLVLGRMMPGLLSVQIIMMMGRIMMMSGRMASYPNQESQMDILVKKLYS